MQCSIDVQHSHVGVFSLFNLYSDTRSIQWKLANLIRFPEAKNNCLCYLKIDKKMQTGNKDVQIKFKLSFATMTLLLRKLP